MPDRPPPPAKLSWTAPRVARLGFLVGAGWDARRIAEDPLILSTAANVYRQTQRFGLAFRDADVALRLPPHVGSLYERAAEKRGLTRDGLIRLLLTVAGDDPALIDNILDDGA
jgi:hypothetical protein